MMINVTDYYKCLAAILIFLTSALLPIYLLKRREWARHGQSMTLGEACATGIFLGAAFFHLLPDASAIFSEFYPSITYPVPQAVCVGSILLFFILERAALANRDWKARTHHILPSTVTVILILHALTEGAALGMGNTLSEVIVLSIAIIAHKGSESFALAMVLLRHGWQKNRVLQLLLFFSAMTPLGILLGSNLSAIHFVQSELLESLFSAFAAGTFIYIAVLHHVQHGTLQEQHAGESTKSLACVAFGVLIMGVLALWA